MARSERIVGVLLSASVCAIAADGLAEVSDGGPDGTPAPVQGADEVIQDPSAPNATVSAAPPSHDSDVTVRGTFYSRAATQLSWSDLQGIKDVLEWWSTSLVSVGESGSRLTWQIGARLEFLARAKEYAGKLQLEAGSYTFEAEPWEVYADYALLPGLRLRIGNQIITWGKLDLASAGDMLGAVDLRHGFAINVDYFRIPTPSVTLAWFPRNWLQIDVGYTPFFTPDRFDSAGTNYALVGPNVPLSRLLAALRSQLNASSLTAFTNALGTVNGPDDRPQDGEVAARGTWRGRWADIGLSCGVLRSKLPLLRLSPALEQALRSGMFDFTGTATGQQLLLADYARYVQTALDIVAPIGPVVVTLEGGYTPARALPTVLSSSIIPDSYVTAMGQVGGKVMYAPSLETQLTAEATLFQAVDGPDAFRRYVFFDGSRRFGLALIAAHEGLGRHVLEATGLGTTSGPSLLVMGKYAYRICEACTLGIGAAAFFGPSQFDWSFGSLQHGLNQVFAEFRWEF